MSRWVIRRSFSEARSLPKGRSTISIVVLSLPKHASFLSDITEFALRKSIVRALKIFHGMGLNWKI
jgi:hypothetical protein